MRGQITIKSLMRPPQIGYVTLRLNGGFDPSPFLASFKSMYGLNFYFLAKNQKRRIESNKDQKKKGLS